MAKGHYIDNHKMYESLVEFKKACNKAKREKLPKPVIPEYIGECFMLIANKLFNRPNFINYTYKDDMISDGIENAVLYISNFNPKKYKNPFAYFTTIIYYAFLRRIQKEKKQLYIKHKLMEHSVINDSLYEGGEDHMTPAYIDMDNDKMKSLVKDFEENLSKKKKKRARKRRLEELFDEDEDD